MEMLLISESKLKITLTPEDMKEFEITCENVDYHSTETRRAFWSILDDAKHKTGFDAASDKVCIQLYPSREGGCEMYVTKIGSADASDDLPALCGGRIRSIAFRFGTLSLLLRSCRQLDRAGYAGEGRAYRSDGGEYLLFIDGITEETLPGKLAFLREFGEETAADAARSEADEHGSLICSEGAVGKLADLI